jgi:hydroxyacylglutathione hydrolase
VLIETVAVGPFQANAYLLADEAAGVAVLIDPGEEGARLVRLVAERQLRLEAIWLTHAHVDHVGGIAAIKRAHDVPIHLHPLDRPIYDRTEELGRMFGLRVEQPPPPEVELSEDQELSLGALRFSVMHAPGHAPGHVVLHGHGVAFVGDCLFAGSVGRTDLPLCNGNDLARSLERIATLPGDTVIYPGHGAASTIARERADNPFLNGTMRITGAV